MRAAHLVLSSLSFVDLYNLLNASTVLAHVDAIGPRFMVPTQILGARIVEFGIQLNF